MIIFDTETQRELILQLLRESIVSGDKIKLVASLTEAVESAVVRHIETITYPERSVPKEFFYRPHNTETSDLEEIK